MIVQENTGIVTLFKMVYFKSLPLLSSGACMHLKLMHMVFKPKTKEFFLFNYRAHHVHTGCSDS